MFHTFFFPSKLAPQCTIDSFCSIHFDDCLCLKLGFVKWSIPICLFIYIIHICAFKKVSPKNWGLKPPTCLLACLRGGGGGAGTISASMQIMSVGDKIHYSEFCPGGEKNPQGDRIYSKNAWLKQVHEWKCEIKSLHESTNN